MQDAMHIFTSRDELDTQRNARIVGARYGSPAPIGVNEAASTITIGGRP